MTTAILDRIDAAFTRGSPIALSFLGATSAYYVAFSYGMGVVVLIFGKDKAAHLFGNLSNNPLLVLVGVPMIPVGLIALEAYDLEGRCLSAWRKSISPWIASIPFIGRMTEWMWPTPTREPLSSSQDGLGGTIDYLARTVSAGLFLPFIAYVLGRVLFKSFTTSNTKRVLLGGIVFYSLKTLVKVYLRQQEYRRQGFRRVLDYAHNHNTDNRQSTL